jgi:hypothetical protein
MKSYENFFLQCICQRISFSYWWHVCLTFLFHCCICNRPHPSGLPLYFSLKYLSLKQLARFLFVVESYCLIVDQPIQLSWSQTIQTVCEFVSRAMNTNRPFTFPLFKIRILVRTLPLLDVNLTPSPFDTPLENKNELETVLQVITSPKKIF